MLDHAAMDGEFRDVEEMVRAAGDYLEVTDDLRPQTIEQARDESRKTPASSRFAVVAVVFCLAMSADMFRGRFSSPPPLLASIRSDGHQLYAAALQKAARANVDPSWSLVDAFRELRRRQASLIEDAF